MDLTEIKTSTIKPEELFHFGNKALDFKIVDFWAWNQSDLIENRNRGVLAEFIVRQALGLTNPTRLEWDEVDFRMEDNFAIEVKSSAYIQAWEQKKFSAIAFDISPKSKLLEDNNYSAEKFRAADIYIFCLLHHQDQKTINPMDLSQWTFFVIPTSVLNEKLPNQKTIGLSTLKTLGIEACDYERLRDTFDKERGVTHN